MPIAYILEDTYLQKCIVQHQIVSILVLADENNVKSDNIMILKRLHEYVGTNYLLSKNRRGSSNKTYIHYYNDVHIFYCYIFINYELNITYRLTLFLFLVKPFYNPIIPGPI